jgi:hypothetical protein
MGISFNGKNSLRSAQNQNDEDKKRKNSDKYQILNYPNSIFLIPADTTNGVESRLSIGGRVAVAQVHEPGIGLATIGLGR